MKMTLVGKRELDFTTDTGDEVRGTSIFVRFPADGVTGEMTAKYFLRPNLLENVPLTVGEVYEVDMNQNGKPAAIKPVAVKPPVNQNPPPIKS